MSDWYIRGLYEVPTRDEAIERAVVAMVEAGYRGGPITLTILPRRRWWQRFTGRSS